jgi:hypothetical protein
MHTTMGRETGTDGSLYGLSSSPAASLKPGKTFAPAKDISFEK